MNKLKILLADDHESFRRLLVSYLNTQKGVEVVGEASDGVEAVEKTGSLRPDVVLMDVHMPRQNGLDATRNIKTQFPSTKVFILSMDPTEFYNQKVQHIADGFIAKSSMKTALQSVLAIEQTNHLSAGAVAAA